MAKGRSVQTMLVPMDGGVPIQLEKAIVFFGRSADCDVVLTTSRKVSRKHCCIAQINDYFVVRDLGSMNGVRVNDLNVTDEHRLNVGDEVWIGDIGFRFAPLNAALIKQAKERAAANEAKAPAPAELKPVKKKNKKSAEIDSRLISQDRPVPLPDERTRPPDKTSRRRSSRDKVVELDDSDVIDSDEEVLELSDDDVVDG